VSSACELVTKINRFLFQQVTGKLARFVDLLEGIDDTQILFDLYHNLNDLSKSLKKLSGRSSSIEKSMINQIAPKTLFQTADPEDNNNRE